MGETDVRLSLDQLYHAVPTVRIKLTDKFAFGQGAWSDIFRGILVHGSNEKIAAKFLRAIQPKDGDDQAKTIERRLRRESCAWIYITKDHPHVNILTLHGICMEGGPSPGLVMPYCESGPVMKYLETHENADRLAFIKGIAAGLTHMHSVGIVHGDLAPNNVLVRHGSPLLSDFGRSRFIDQEGLSASIAAGTIRYMSQELLPSEDIMEDTAYAPKVNKPSDVYAFGMVALEVSSGEKPFRNVPSNYHIPNYVKRGQRPKQQDYHRIANHDALWAIMESSWAFSPGDRPDMRSISHEIAHLLPTNSRKPEDRRHNGHAHRR